MADQSEIASHEMIRKNVLLATRNFNERVKNFIKHIIMAKGSDMPVKYYNYKVEFQNVISSKETQRILLLLLILL